MCDAHFVSVQEFNICGPYVYKESEKNPVASANKD